MVKNKIPTKEKFAEHLRKECNYRVQLAAVDTGEVPPCSLCFG
jgi:aconitase B